MGNIILHDKEFRPFIEATKIDQVITRMAEQMNRELADTQPLFLSILNGSFMFTSDLIKQIVIPGTQISFVKVASYSGTCSTGAIQELIGLKEDIQNRTVVILEDIIDSGRTLHYLIPVLKQRNPKSIRLCALLNKPDRREVEVQIDYLGFDIPDEFFIGYGLDYAQKYRNLPFIGVVEPEAAEDAEEGAEQASGEEKGDNVE